LKPFKILNPKTVMSWESSPSPSPENHQTKNPKLTTLNHHNKKPSEEKLTKSLLRRCPRPMPLMFWNFSPHKLLKRKSPKKSHTFIQWRTLRSERSKLSKDQKSMPQSFLKCTIQKKEFLTKTSRRSPEEEKLKKLSTLKPSTSSTSNDHPQNNLIFEII